MLCLYQPFMRMWAGDTLVLSELDMVLFCIYFYCINMNNMRNLYFNGNGLWWAANTSFILESAFNLILNFGLGYYWGTTGILVATILTIIVFNFIARTNILFREYFHISPKAFYFDHAKYLTVTSAVGCCSYYISHCIPIEGIIGIMIRGIICICLPNILFFIIYRNMKMYKKVIDLMPEIDMERKTKEEIVKSKLINSKKSAPDFDEI